MFAHWDFFRFRRFETNRWRIILINPVKSGVFSYNANEEDQRVMPFPICRLTDMHVCPMFTGPVPHVGGPITGPGAPTVLAMNLPVSCLGDLAVCVGPPDTVVMGSPTVLAMGRPVTRMTSTCAHGGTVIGPGAITVLVP